MPQKYVFLAAQDVFSINRIVYVLGWIRFPAPFDPEEVLRCLTHDGSERFAERSKHTWHGAVLLGSTATSVVGRPTHDSDQ